MTWELKEDVREERARETVKQHILAGRDKWPQWDARYGQVKWREAALLDSMSPEELNRTHDEVTDLRRRMGMSRDEQRVDLRERADSARGYAIPRAGDNDSLSSESVATTSTPTSIPLSAEQLKFFVNPETNQTYTAKEAKKLFSTNPKLVRLLMRENLDYFNAILQGN